MFIRLKKHSILLLFCSLTLITCNPKNSDSNQGQASESVSENGSSEKKYARIKFESPEYEFGTVKQGELVNHTFTFKNDSDEPLIISNASASCGCTVPQWPKDPVKPGEEGKIQVQFNSTGKSGIQNKTVIITANTLPNTTTISLKGAVEAPEVLPNTPKSTK